MCRFFPLLHDRAGVGGGDEQARPPPQILEQADGVDEIFIDRFADQLFVLQIGDQSPFLFRKDRCQRILDREVDLSLPIEIDDCLLLQETAEEHGPMTRAFCVAGQDLV